MKRIWMICAFALSCTLLHSTSAAALDDVRRGSFSLAVLGGHGFGKEVDDDGANRFGVAYGVRGGYSFGATGVYLGFTLLRYEGGSGDVGDVDSVTLSAEAGYDFEAGPVVVRPYVGLGSLLGRISQQDNVGATLHLLVTPAVLVRYPIGPVSVGAELRYEAVSEWTQGLSMLGSVGVSF